MCLLATTTEQLGEIQLFNTVAVFFEVLRETVNNIIDDALLTNIKNYYILIMKFNFIK